MKRRNGLSPAGLARGRSRVYRFLAVAFAPPTPERLGSLSRGRGLVLPRRLAWALSPETLDRLGALDSCVRAWRHRRPADVDDRLTRDYQRLFVGPYHLPAPPWESCYRPPGGPLMGPPAVEVARRYAEAGFPLPPRAHILPDHIARELGFLALLAAAEARAWRAAGAAVARPWLERQAGFLAEHLAVWIEPFSDRVAQAARFHFHRLLAGATAAWVADDLTLVGAVRDAAA